MIPILSPRQHVPAANGMAPPAPSIAKRAWTSFKSCLPSKESAQWSLKILAGTILFDTLLHPENRPFERTILGLWPPIYPSVVEDLEKAIELGMYTESQLIFAKPLAHLFVWSYTAVVFGFPLPMIASSVKNTIQFITNSVAPPAPIDQERAP